MLFTVSTKASSLNCLPDQYSSIIPRPFRTERKLALTCLNTQITLQYKPHKRATKLIVTILTDINACNNVIYLKQQTQGSDHISSGGMIFTDFIPFFYRFCFFLLIFKFFVFLGYYTTFCLVSCISLSIFGHRPLRERGDGQSPHPSWNVNFWS